MQHILLTLENNKQKRKRKKKTTKLPLKKNQTIKQTKQTHCKLQNVLTNTFDSTKRKKTIKTKQNLKKKSSNFISYLPLTSIFSSLSSFLAHKTLI